MKEEWPQKGAISATNLNLRYRENMPRVLKNVSFSIKAGMKVGVVGRTGAGKSSIVQALLRLVEPDEDSVIEIDGIKIKEIGLKTLREAISLIPQTPYLFKGTIRYNLDPFD